MNIEEKDKIAIYAVDPGTISGVAYGTFPPTSDSVWEALAGGKWDSYEVHGSPAEQAWEIIGNYAEWLNWPHVRWRHCHLVFEDFVVRLGPGASSKRELLDPVRVTSACDALCLKRDGMRWAFPTFQQPNLAKNYATNERLRRHGLWVKGSEHRRDAVRHLARFYANLLGAA